MPTELEDPLDLEGSGQDPLGIESPSNDPLGIEDKPALDLSKLKLDASKMLVDPVTGLKRPSGMEAGTEFLGAVGASPVGQKLMSAGEKLGEAISHVPEAISLPGKAAAAMAADLWASGLDQPQYGKNVHALLQGEELPARRFIAESAKYAPNLAIAANLGQSVTEMAPALGMAALPAWMNRLIAAGFTADMIKNTPEQARQLGEQLGLPKEQQDPGKIASLKSGLLQTVVLAPLAGAGALSRPVEVGLTRVREHSLRRMAELSAEEAKRTGAPTVTETTPPVPAAEMPTTPTATGMRPAIRLVGGEVVDEQGRFHDREQTAAITGQPTQQEVARQHSTDLPEAKERVTSPMERADQVAKMTDAEFSAAFKGGMNPENWSLGETASAEDVTRLKAHYQALVDELTPLREKIKSKKATAEEGRRAMMLGVKSQYFNEAIQAAPKEVGGQGRIFSGAEERARTRAAKAPATPATAAAPAAAMGGGAAELGEVGTGAAEDIMGVRQKTREQQAAAGQPVVAQPNEGVSLTQSLEDGRSRLVRDPAAADRAAEEFERSGTLSAPSFNVVRAKYEQVMTQGRRVAEQFGTMSPQYHAARMEAFKWSDLSKRMQTEWHKLGMGQQGETDIDTGNLLDLETDYHGKTGKDMTPDQRKRGERIANTNKQAQDQTAAAQEALNRHLLNKGTGGMTAAEKRAFDAANKTVREWAIKVAEAENKTRVARTVQEREVAKIQEARARKGLEDAQQVARDAAVKLAYAENRARVDAAAKERADADQLKASQAALDAANKTVREAAARSAEAENKARSTQATRDKAVARVQAKAAKKALDAANERARKVAADHAALERKLQGDPILRVWTKAKEYIDQGLDSFDDIRKKVATDLGMSIEQVTRLMQQDKRTKYLADDLWRKQQVQRNLRSQAKRWVQGLSTPGYIKALQSIPKVMFGLKVGFHGTVALGTHAPTVAFQPRFWSAYVRDFGKMYKMVGSKAYYENQVQDLMRRNNYTPARRAGLVNDPFVYEDYNSPDTTKYFAGLTGMGNRGYTVLKILRQDMFDQHWNQLPKSAQIPEMAQAIADGVNHATGVVKKGAHPAFNLALFAPRLEASRVAWLVVDPAKAAGTLLNWKNASMGEKLFAKNQLKEKAWVVGTLGSLLALNQGFLSAVGSDQKINVTDPFANDFLKFKVAGMNLSYGNPMITMARLPLRLFVGIKNEGKFSKLVYEDENVATVMFEYVRSQMSPFAGTTTDLALGRDYMRRPLPRAGFGLLPGKTNIPKRLQAEGIKPYTWTEYSSQQAAMIPLQEALKEVWGKDLLMSAADRERSLKALATIIVMGGTGARVSEDYSLRPSRSGAMSEFPTFSSVVKEK